MDQCDGSQKEGTVGMVLSNSRVEQNVCSVFELKSKHCLYYTE